MTYCCNSDNQQSLTSSGNDSRQLLPGWSRLPKVPCTFILPARLAMTTVRPFSETAAMLQPGDQLTLQPEPDHPRDPCAVRAVTSDHKTAGYLYAQTAGWMTILLQAAPPQRDQTQVCRVLRGASDDPAAVPRRRYPVVTIRISLNLREAWPLYTIAAIVGFRSEQFTDMFNIAGNQWLQPLAEGYRLCRRQSHDAFHMPESLIDAWRQLTTAGQT